MCILSNRDLFMSFRLHNLTSLTKNLIPRPLVSNCLLLLISVVRSKNFINFLTFRSGYNRKRYL